MLKLFLKIVLLPFLAFNSNLFADLFSKADNDGYYLNVGVRNTPDSFYSSIGYSYFITNNFYFNSGLMIMNSSKNNYEFIGLELAVKRYFGSRFSPFIGVGFTFGCEDVSLVVDYENDSGWETSYSYNDPNYYNKNQEDRFNDDDTNWMVTVFPEVGISYFISSDVSCSFSTTYHITNGLTDNFWINHLSLTYSY